MGLKPVYKVVPDI
jgi:cytosolic carboxypeptidase protein 5